MISYLKRGLLVAGVAAITAITSTAASASGVPLANQTCAATTGSLVFSSSFVISVSAGDVLTFSRNVGGKEGPYLDLIDSSGYREGNEGTTFIVPDVNPPMVRADLRGAYRLSPSPVLPQPHPQPNLPPTQTQLQLVRPRATLPPPRRARPRKGGRFRQDRAAQPKTNSVAGRVWRSPAALCSCLPKGWSMIKALHAVPIGMHGFQPRRAAFQAAAMATAMTLSQVSAIG